MTKLGPGESLFWIREALQGDEWGRRMEGFCMPALCPGQCSQAAARASLKSQDVAAPV